MTEAISSGVPLYAARDSSCALNLTDMIHTSILWPFNGDQPLNTVHITDNLQIGYELLEVRTGDGLKPIYRTGYTPKGTVEAVKAEAREVLTKAFGEDGARKRENIRKLQKGALELWKEGGEARRAAEQLLDDVAVCVPPRSTSWWARLTVLLASCARRPPG